MPTDTEAKPFLRRRGSSVSSDQWSPHITPSFVRSRGLALLAVFILWLIWYNHGSKPGPTGPNYDAVNWSKYAYSQYATDGARLCNAVMVFEALHRLGSRADRILFYPAEWDTFVSHSKDRDSQLLVRARDMYKVKLIPTNLQSVRAHPTSEDDEEVWDFSMNIFHAWNRTEYDRIMHLNSAITMNQHLDELFFLPDTNIAMTRAYWQLPKVHRLSPNLIVLKPSKAEYSSLIHEAYTSEMHKINFGEEILNERYGESALVLPHRNLVMVTNELRNNEHRQYMGGYVKNWDPAEAIKEAKIVKFADDPLPKPWIMWPINLLMEIQPKCKVKPGTPEESGCEDREQWKGLYNEYRQRRKDVCRLLSIPAPDWPPPKNNGNNRWDD